MREILAVAFRRVFSLLNFSNVERLADKVKGSFGTKIHIS